MRCCWGSAWRTVSNNVAEIELDFNSVFCLANLEAAANPGNRNRVAVWCAARRSPPRPRCVDEPDKLRESKPAAVSDAFVRQQTTREEWREYVSCMSH